MLFPLLSLTCLAVGVSGARPREVPAQALVVDWKSFIALEMVEAVSVQNFTTNFFPPGISEEEALAKPFHIYDEAFYDIIGPNPTLTLIATTESDPIFHEAVVWYPPTEEVFFVQNAGAAAAGTGLLKSNLIYKIALSQAEAVSSERNATGKVDVVEVKADPPIINSNGATNFQGQIVFTSEGQGNETGGGLVLMNPLEPYNTTVLVNNFFGRQFNSPNDVVINPRNGEIYFTDSLYGYVQNFRPPPGLPTQVYRLNPQTGSLSVVADGFDKPNGLTFSPKGDFAYVTDTGSQSAAYGYNLSAPATIYRYTVLPTGQFSNRETFAFATPGIPDGVHCDTQGNVYSAVGDGVHVWNPAGVLLGKIFLGSVAANFRFAGRGRMVIPAQTKLFYVTLKAEGADPEDQF